MKVMYANFIKVNKQNKNQQNLIFCQLERLALILKFLLWSLCNSKYILNYIKLLRN